MEAKSLGEHAMAVLVHAMWAAAITEARSAPRATAVTLRAGMTNSLLDRHLQVVSTHLPGCMRATDEEYDQYDLYVQCGCMAEALAQSLAARGLTVPNTFSTWRDRLDSKPLTKNTRSGKIFGHTVHRPIHYIATDWETAACMTTA